MGWSEPEREPHAYLPGWHRGRSGPGVASADPGGVQMEYDEGPASSSSGCSLRVSCDFATGGVNVEGHGRRLWAG